MKTTRAMPSFQGVAAGQKATLNLPIGRTYHRLILTRGGTTFTHDHLGTITLKANGRPIWECTAADLDDMQAHDGLAVGGASITVIDFERVGLLNKAWVEMTAIGTGAPRNVAAAANDPVYNPVPITSLTLEVNISGSASAPTLSAKAEQSAPKPSRGFVKRRSFTYNPSAAGEFAISDLPKGDVVNRIWVKAAGDNLDAVRLERDNFVLFERTEEENEALQSDGVKAPVANWFVIDPTERGNGDEPIGTAVQDFRLILTMSAADTITVYMDYLGDLRGN